MPGGLLFVPQVAPYRDGPAGVHGVLPAAATGVAEVAELCGLRPEVAPDVREIDDAQLARARVLALFTIGETPWTPAKRTEILGRLRDGSLGVVAIHSATDSCYGWEEYGLVVGARFDGHPWTQHVGIDVCAPEHPACAHLGDRWHWHDEVYQFRDLRADADVLLRVAGGELDLSVPGAAPPPFGYPLAWCFEEGAGRAFSTALGHFPAAWESTAYLRHLAGGLAWVLGA